jgi:hypothetical protein
MMPGILAAADLLMMDSANLRYATERMPADAADRLVAPLGWTVRETIGHIVLANERFAYHIVQRLRGIPFSGVADEAAEVNAEAVARTNDIPVRDLLARLDISATSLIAAYKALPDQASGSKEASKAMQNAVAEDAAHMSHHAIDLVDAVPELRTDPMVLNWVLYVDYTGDERRSAAQMTLLKEVRDAILAADGELEDADGE